MVSVIVFKANVEREGYKNMENPQYPQRKRMRVKGLDYSKQGAYFITICTHNRQPLFGEIVWDHSVGATLRGRPNKPDRMIEKWLLEIENKFPNTEIDEYVIMPDHIHAILFFTGDHTGSPLQDIVDWFKTMTTNEYIRGVKEGIYEPYNKSFWQRSYFDHMIRNQDDLYETRKYIINNPRAWYYDDKKSVRN